MRYYLLDALISHEIWKKKAEHSSSTFFNSSMKSKYYVK